MWEHFESVGNQLTEGILDAARAAGIPLRAGRVGSMFGFFFTDGPVIDWETAKVADTARFAAYFQAMLDNGVYLAPSQFEAGFLSTAHGPAEIEATIAAAERALAAIA